MNITEIRNQLINKGLKITPQRMAVLDAVFRLNHPTAEHITDFIKVNHPNIAIGTVYKTLETFVEKKLVKKVKTEQDIMRYDAIIDHHHHIYCSDSDRIEDYFDEDLDVLLKEYFSNKTIKNFEIADIKIQILGKFKK